MQIDRVVVVTRKTRLQEAVRRYNTKQQAKFVVQSRGQSFEDIEVEDQHYQETRDLIGRELPRGVPVQYIDRTYLPNFIFAEGDVVVCIGQDGLVVNTAKYLNNQPIVAVNPDPERFDGVLLPFRVADVKQALDLVSEEKHKVRSITMARVDLNDGQALYAFNDFFIGPKSHTSALYTIRYQGKAERHSSSGIIVSTPAGSTGWLSSLFNMANGIMDFSGVHQPIARQAIPWETPRLLFVVREPFESRWSAAKLVAGEINASVELVLESHMAEGGTIFSDGVEADFLQFNSGTVATVKLAEKKTMLVVKQT